MPDDPHEKKEQVAPPPDDLTRRAWLLRLGETVALLGFSGVAGQAEMAAVSGLAESQLPALPPGLYEPSSDHLGHVLTLDDRYHPIPPGSETDYVKPRTGPYSPQFFSPAEFQALRRIVALLLGERGGASPGGAAADETTIVHEVAEWIDLTVASSAGVCEAARQLSPEHRNLAVRFFGGAAVEEVERSDPQRVCREGLSWLAEAAPGKDFLSLREEEQIQLLKTISDGHEGKTGDTAGTKFFALLKSGVIHGFYTSRQGLKELDYKGNAFYAESPGCPEKTP